MREPLCIELANVLVRLYRARKARRDANKAMSQYLAESWGENEFGDDTLATKHAFGCCQLGSSDEDTAILCSVCEGGKPFHLAQLKAGREAGNALRQAQAIGKRFSEDRDEMKGEKP